MSDKFAMLLFVGGMIITYLLFSTILNVRLKDILHGLHTIREAILNTIGRMASYFTGVTTKKFGVESRKKKQKSLLYRYNVFMLGIIQDIGFGASVTPEYTSIFIGIASFILMLICSSIITNVIIQVLLFITIYVAVVAAMFLISRSKARYRQRALLLAENLLCQNIKPSMIQTVEVCIDKIDASIRPYFQKYRVQIVNQKASSELALDELNMVLGPSFDDFCNKMSKLELEGKPGMIDTFKDNIDRNSLILRLLTEKAERNKRMNMVFVGTVAIILAFVLITIVTFEKVRLFYISTIGQAVLVLLIMLPVLVLCYCQYCQNKKYKEDGT